MTRRLRASRAGAALAASAVLVALLASCSSSPKAASTVQTLPGPIRSMMIVGDSITTGEAGDVTWRCRLWQHLQADHVRINFVGPYTTLYNPAARTQNSHDYGTKDCDYDHGGIWGRTADQERDSIFRDVSRYKPDVLVVMLGTDDLVYISDAQTAEDKMSDIITEARGGNPNLRIVLSEIPPKDTRNIPGLSQQMAAYNAGLVDLAKTETTAASPIAVANPDPGYNAMTDNYDGTHPNPIGEYKIASAVADTLSAKFGLGKPFGPIPKVSPNPPAPKSVVATSRPGGAQLLWSEVPSSTAYGIYYRVAGTSRWTELPGIFQKRTFLATELVPGQTYEFAISSVRYRDQSVLSAPVSVTPN